MPVPSRRRARAIAVGSCRVRPGDDDTRGWRCYPEAEHLTSGGWKTRASDPPVERHLSAE